MAIIVLDASVIIAFLDSADAHHPSAREAVSRMRDAELVIPASAYAEILVDPWQHGSDAVALVKRFLMDLSVRIEPLTAAVAERAAKLRSSHRTLRLPDALVLATAETLGATALTCDRSWPRVSRRARLI